MRSKQLVSNTEIITENCFKFTWNAGDEQINATLITFKLRKKFDFFFGAQVATAWGCHTHVVPQAHKLVCSTIRIWKIKWKSRNFTIACGAHSANGQSSNRSSSRSVYQTHTYAHTRTHIHTHTNKVDTVNWRRAWKEFFLSFPFN